MTAPNKHDVWGRRVAVAIYATLLVFLDAQSDRGYEHGNSSDHAEQEEEAGKYRGSIIFFMGRVWLGVWRWLHEHGNAEAVLAVFTIGLMFVTALLWYHTRRISIDAGETGRLAAIAAKSSADASLLSVRPWLSCEVKAMEPLLFNEAGAPVFKLRITVRNVGQTPAMSVRMNYELHILAPGVPATPLRLQLLTWLARGIGVQRPPMNQTYEEMQAATDAGQLLNPTGLVLFPRERHREYHAIPIPKAYIMEHSKDMGAEVSFWPELVVLVSYGYNMAETPATTGLIFRLSKPRRMPFRMGETVPAEDIEVELHDMWGGFTT